MQAFPGETPEYRKARDGLLQLEIELRREMEAVAQARRALPRGGEVPEDYVFEGFDDNGAVTQVKLSELFEPGKDSLAIYNYMFPRHSGDERPGPQHGESAKLPLALGPCPSCTALIDQLDAAEPHIAAHANLVVVAKAPIDRVATFGRERGWRNIRLLSSGGNSFARDYNGEIDGQQMPMMNVFQREADAIWHFWGSEMLYAPADPNQDPRHMGTVEPAWNMFDLMPAGRGTDWDEQLDYNCCH
ncbi:MAG: DUF899 family protein [Acidimicrobiia bacterium]|nr:DUF899 family protein [Acidimicrobiia bacterium]